MGIPEFVKNHCGGDREHKIDVFCAKCHGGVFLGFKCGDTLVVPKSRGAGRKRWEIIPPGGGVICENGHFTEVDGR